MDLWNAPQYNVGKPKDVNMQPVGPANTMILTDYPQKCFQIIG
jgi:hypothetical protein